VKVGKIDAGKKIAGEDPPPGPDGLDLLRSDRSGPDEEPQGFAGRNGLKKRFQLPGPSLQARNYRMAGAKATRGAASGGAGLEEACADPYFGEVNLAGIRSLEASRIHFVGGRAEDPNEKKNDENPQSQKPNHHATCLAI
jgi:hypothetical protein